MLLLGNILWTTTGAGSAPPPPPPPPAEHPSFGRAAWLAPLGLYELEERQHVARIKLREEAGVAAEVIEELALQQVEDSETVSESQQILVRELEAKGIEYETKFAEILAEYRQFLIDEEIRKYLQYDEDIEAILLIASATI